MQTEQLHQHILNQLGIVVFKCHSEGAIIPVGAVPEWYSKAENIGYPGLGDSCSQDCDNANASFSLDWHRVDSTIQGESIQLEGNTGRRKMYLESARINIDGQTFLLLRRNQEKTYCDLTDRDPVRNVRHYRNNQQLVLENLAFNLQNPIAGFRDSLCMIKEELDDDQNLGILVQAGLNQADKIYAVVDGALRDLKTSAHEQNRSDVCSLPELLYQLPPLIDVKVTVATKALNVLISGDKLLQMIATLIAILRLKIIQESKVSINLEKKTGFVNISIVGSKPSEKVKDEHFRSTLLGSLVHQNEAIENCYYTTKSVGGRLIPFSNQKEEGYHILLPTQL